MPLQTKLISISLQGEDAILPGLHDRASLLAILENSSEVIDCYSENSDDFYRFEVVDRSSLSEVLTFEEANQRGVLDALLKKRDTKTNLGLPGDRFVGQMRKMRDAVIGGDDSVCGEARSPSSKDSLEPKSPLQKQWALQKESLSVTRKMAHPLFNESLFEMKEGDWSDVEVSKEGPIFFQVTETFVDNSQVHTKMEEGRALLGCEAKIALVKELLEKIGSNGS